MTLPKEFWDIIPIQPIPTLDALRNAILERTTKRMPKWKFKLADPPLFPKIVMTLQPKVLLKTLWLPGFQGEAKMDYSEELHCDITFRLLIADQWRFKAWSVHQSRHAPFTHRSEENHRGPRTPAFVTGGRIFPTASRHDV